MFVNTYKSQFGLKLPRRGQRIVALGNNVLKSEVLGFESAVIFVTKYFYRVSAMTVEDEIQDETETFVNDKFDRTLDILQDTREAEASRRQTMKLTSERI